MRIVAVMRLYKLIHIANDALPPHVYGSVDTELKENNYIHRTKIRFIR